MVSWRILAAGWLLLASIPAAGAEVILEAVPAGDCTLRLEAAENWPSLRLRASHPNQRPCFVGKEAVIQVLMQAFSEPHPALKSRTFTSLALGRLIDYPWLVQFLALHAARDRGWDSSAGKPAAADINRYVADILSAPEIVLEIEAPLREHGYRISGVSVEKVLVGGFADVPLLEGPQRKGKIPFDAQVWFRLEKR
jgi:hypothetical protein